MENYNLNVINEATDKKLPNVSKTYRIIDGKYLCYKNYVLGTGSFGKVLYGMNTDKTIEYAIKFEKSTVKHSVLLEELKIYTELKGGEGIPKIHWYGKYKDYKVMVMDLLGPSLDKFFKISEKKLSLETTVNFGEQMISRLEFVHSKNILHRDIKPNNFLLGRFNRNFSDNTVYVVDFGLSKEYIDPHTKQHYDFKEGRRFVGTPRYASVNTHLGIRQSRRDDIESVAYILVYFLKGDLPWQGIRAKTKSEKKEKIKLKKKHTMTEDLCEGLPEEMCEFMEYSRRLKFEQKPDYEYLRNLLKSIKAKYAYTTNVFAIEWEWNKVFLQIKDNDNLKQKEIQHIKKKFDKLYEGYPMMNFEEYLGAVDKIHTNIRENRINDSNIGIGMSADDSIRKKNTNEKINNNNMSVNSSRKNSERYYNSNTNIMINNITPIKKDMSYKSYGISNTIQGNKESQITNMNMNMNNIITIKNINEDLNIDLK